MKQSILLNSGGKDTMAAAMLLTREGWELHSLYCDLGQRNSSAAQYSAAQIADQFCSSHNVVKITGNDYLHLNHYGYHSIVAQTLSLLTLATMEALSRDIGAVASGVRTDVVNGDLPEKWITLLSCFRNIKTIPTYLWPIFTMNEEAIRLLVWDSSWQSTITCNFDPPCGTCYKCRVRNQWFTLKGKNHG